MNGSFFFFIIIVAFLLGSAYFKARGLSQTSVERFNEYSEFLVFYMILGFFSALLMAVQSIFRDLPTGQMGKVLYGIIAFCALFYGIVFAVNLSSLKSDDHKL